MSNFIFEQIETPHERSFKYSIYNKTKPNANNFKWHYHPEIELVYIDRGSGIKGVGNHISNYYDGDLILVGSNLHHMAFTENFSDNKTEVVIQFKPDFLGNSLSFTPELNKIHQLFVKAKSGLSFSDTIKNEVGETILGLQYETYFQSFLTLISVLNKLANSDMIYLNNSNLEDVNENNQLKRLFNFVKYNFKEEINLKQASEKVSMTIPAFCRYFKRNTGKTFIRYVNEYRVKHASKLLMQTDMDVKSICYESGFNNFSNFIRFFKKYNNLSPKKFREKMFQNKT